MAVPSSGQLRLRADIANEVNGSATGSNISLRALSASAGKSAPDTMSEFYGYSAVEPPSIIALYSSSNDSSVYARIRLGNTGGENPYSTGVYIGTSTNMTSNPKYELGAGSIYQYKGYRRSGLSASTTYYWWGYATNSGGTTYTARQTRATGVAVSYSTYDPPGFQHYPSEPEMYVQEAAGRNEFNLNWQYHHVYNGWTNAATFNKVVSNGAYPSVNKWEIGGQKDLWGRTGALTSNRLIFRYRLGAPFWAPQPRVTMDMRVGDGSSTYVGWEYYNGSVARDNPNRSFSSSGTTSNGTYVGYEYNNNEGYYAGRSYYISDGASQPIDITRIMNQTHYG